ncbi:MAG: RNA-binding transcriptional accessory protein [Proteobacteria bacterium]|nr:RNA-binding transcriptional accessory protein [Pseudomonadota bacterium]
MNPNPIIIIAEELKIKPGQVEAVKALLDDSATVPFIARYRKEVTESLDEVVITAIRDRLVQLKDLEERKESILKSLEQHGHLTDELKEKVIAADTMAVLEDIYLPYKPKRRTKATVAREKGLEPLAVAIFDQKGIDPEKEAGTFIDPEKGVESIEDALSGARDIIAEMVNEHQDVRAELRELFIGKGMVKTTVIEGKEKEGAKYRDYFEWEEPLKDAPSHRILAMRRGEKEEILNMTIAPSSDDALNAIKNIIIKGNGRDAEQVDMAIQDCYKRLLSRSMETEARVFSKEKADQEAIKIFTENLRQLLLSPPLGSKRVLGIDPGFRTGCKVVCLDRQGKLLHNDTIFPNLSDKQTKEAGLKIESLVKQFEIEAIAVGNGTAGKETENFIRALSLPKHIIITLVNESGASIYSASEIAREEFPDLDLTVKGAVSIGRRMMDPLSELVKIDPKSIGVGQYQHDVDQSALKNSLDDVVASCVNGVGVDVNRASVQLLTYVSGLGPQLAKNIVIYRDENGPFDSRTQLKKVPRLGPKAFEQSAGFLRIRDGKNALDASAVHPESYPVVDRMAKDLSCEVADLLKDDDLRKKIDISAYVTDKIGLPTLQDILSELSKPGRDPRETFEEFSFKEGVDKISDLLEGMRLPGIVTNITAFGVFVDIGVHQDGLVHISQLADHFVKDPATVVKVAQKVMVTVTEVDLERKRISLSMKSGKPKQEKSQTQIRPKTAGPKKQKEKSKPQSPGNPSPKSEPFNNPFAALLRK